MTEKRRQNLSTYQTDIRIRSPGELDNLKKKAVLRNKTEAICPHCNFIGTNKPAMMRWHFNRFLKAPLPLDFCKNPKIEKN